MYKLKEGEKIMIKCFGCGKDLHETALSCPSCGAVTAKKVVKPTQEVSPVMTFFFGCIYFLIKGWPVSALVALILAIVTSGISWVILPFFAEKFVNFFD